MCRAATIAALCWACAWGDADAAEHKAIRIADGIYAVRPAALRDREAPVPQGNTVFIIGPNGVAVIDTGISSQAGVEVIAAVRRVTREPIRLVILTHPGQEVIFGAAAFQARGIPILMHRDAAALMASRC